MHQVGPALTMALVTSRGIAQLAVSLTTAEEAREILSYR